MSTTRNMPRIALAFLLLITLFAPQKAVAADYVNSKTATKQGVSITVSWNSFSAGQETTFHVTGSGGMGAQSGTYKFYMAGTSYEDPVYGWEPICDPSRVAGYTKEQASAEYTLTPMASGNYRLHFYLMDMSRPVTIVDMAFDLAVSDDNYPATSTIVNNVVSTCREQTDGSAYGKALWLHDWLIDHTDYDHSLKWCSVESALCRQSGTCESYQQTYAKLLDAAGIKNARIVGNGHTWNAVKIDGNWCQVDATWDDSDDHWYDFDQRHLCFGLSDELMAVAHPDHTSTYQAPDYGQRSNSLDNNYFIRNKEAANWANEYATLIQQQLDAGTTSFELTATNTSYPPSIKNIVNPIVAYALNSKTWISLAGELQSFTATYQNDKFVCTAIIREDNDPQSLVRISGGTRYQTMGALVDYGQLSGSSTAIIASGANYPDALAAASLAGETGAPILLTEPRSLSPEVEAKLTAMHPKQVFIIGGTSAISEGTLAHVRTLLGSSCTVTRISGNTRYETCLQIEKQLSGNSDTVIVATGTNYADALSISPFAYATGSPVMLCSPSSGLDTSLLNEIRARSYSKALIAGGTSAVPPAVERQLSNAGVNKITRLSGSTRYETSAKIAEYELTSTARFSMNGVLFATGQNYPDALAAGPVAGKQLAPLLLLDPGASAACHFLSAHGNTVDHAAIVGGTAAISEHDASTLATTLGIQYVENAR